jgi:hypothetical protein
MTTSGSSSIKSFDTLGDLNRKTAFTAALALGSFRYLSRQKIGTLRNAAVKAVRRDITLEPAARQLSVFKNHLLCTMKDKALQQLCEAIATPHAR